MIDPKTIVKVGKAALRAASEIEKYGNRNTARMEEMWEIERRTWQAQRLAATERRLQALEDATSDKALFEQQLEEMLSDHQFHKLQANVEYDAVRESTDGRRVLLAYLAAGLSDPNLSINEKARLQRTIHGLDSADVLLLDRLDRIDDRSFVPDPKKPTSADDQLRSHLLRIRYMAAQEEPIARDVLVSAGCLYADFQDFGGPSANVTRLGAQLLKVLAFYLADHRSP